MSERKQDQSIEETFAQLDELLESWRLQTPLWRNPLPATRPG